MKHGIDTNSAVTLTCGRKDGKAFIETSKGQRFEGKGLEVSTLLQAMIFQTLRSRFDCWDAISGNFQIDLTIYEVVD